MSETRITKEELSHRICNAERSVSRAEDRFAAATVNAKLVAEALAHQLKDIQWGVDRDEGIKRLERLRKSLNGYLNEISYWEKERLTCIEAVVRLRCPSHADYTNEAESEQPVGLPKRLPMTASEAEQEKGAAYGYDAKGNRGCLAASPSRLKLEEVTSDQELEQAARQAIRAEQIYQQVADEMKAAQSTSEASCSDSSALQQ